MDADDEIKEVCQNCEWEMPRRELELYEGLDMPPADEGRHVDVAFGPPYPEPVTRWRCRDLLACQQRQRAGPPAS